jgi:hypothetical protein
MAELDTHPASGGGSCARCLAPLKLDAVRDGGTWYCSPACAQGLPPSERIRLVAEPRLYHRPQRFFRKRQPTELRRPNGS